MHSEGSVPQLPHDFGLGVYNGLLRRWSSGLEVSGLKESSLASSQSLWDAYVILMGSFWGCRPLAMNQSKSVLSPM